MSIGIKVFKTVYQRHKGRRSAIDKLIASMREGHMPWLRPKYTDENSGLPKDVGTGKEYRGINPWLLEITSREEGFRSRWWGTRESWEGVNAAVPSRSCAHVYSKEGLTPVFNAEQVANAERFRVGANVYLREGFDLGSNLVKQWDIQVVTGGNRCLYDKLNDIIIIPEPSKFRDSDEYYSSKVHEIIHWMIFHSKRSFTEDFEELVCEMATAILMDNDGYFMSQCLDNCKEFLNIWLNEMNLNLNYFFKASDAAFIIADSLLNRVT